MSRKQFSGECDKRGCVSNREQLQYTQYENDSLKQDIKYAIERLERARSRVSSTHDELASKAAENDMMRAEITDLSKSISAIQRDTEVIELSNLSNARSIESLELRLAELSQKYADFRATTESHRANMKSKVIFSNHNPSTAVTSKDAQLVRQLSLTDIVQDDADYLSEDSD